MGAWRAFAAKCSKVWASSSAWLAAVFGIITICLIVVVAIQAVAISQTYTEISWGSVAEALGAVAGLVAAVGTVGTLWVAVVGWRHEVRMRRSDEQRRAQAERRAQADLMAAWIDSYTFERSLVVIGLINASSGVIYDVEVHIALETELAQLPGVRGRSDFPVGPYYVRAFVPVVQPGEWKIRLRTPSTEYALIAVDLDVYFRDQQGVGWTRDLAGRLEESGDPIFEVPKISEKLARSVDPLRLVQSDHIMVQRPPLSPP